MKTIMPEVSISPLIQKYNFLTTSGSDDSRHTLKNTIINKMKMAGNAMRDILSTKNAQFVLFLFVVSWAA